MLEQASNCNIAITEFLKGLIDSSQEVVDIVVDGEVYQEMKYRNHKIERRKDGRWQARLREDGRQYSIYGKSQTEVIGKLKEIYSEKKKLLKPPTRLFEAWQSWYEKYKAPLYKERTLKNIRSVFRNQIQVYFKDIALKDLKAVDINLALESIKQPRMKEFTYQYIKEFVKDMYEEKLMHHDIAGRIKPFHSVRQEGKSLSVEQRKVMIEKSYQMRGGEMFRFYLFSGIRPAELFALTDEDIEENFIHIRGTKTQKSDRYIPKFKHLNEVLINFKGKKGKLFDFSETTRKRRLYEMRELCGFHFNIKDLRTTFATMCAENGIQQNVIAKWLGHTNVSTTNKYYIKVLNDYELEQIKGLEDKIDTHFKKWDSV